jgi:4-amino-4-deoxy-L-arabinose transferase-like glycosyltransferase
MPARQLRFAFTGFLAILALSAMVTLFISTPAGVGLTNDSAAYIAGARSMLQGTGYSDIWLDSSLEPITHYPPLFSLSLAAIGLLQIDPLRGARILNIILFGANTTLMGLLGWRLTRSQAAGLWLAALFSFSSSMLRIHVYALSEPLFIFFSLLSFLFIDLSFGKKRKTIALVLAGLATGLGFLTRYSALALLPTFVIVLFLFLKSWRSRLTGVIMLFGGILPLMAAWFIRNELTAGNITNRTFQYHPITAKNITPGIYNFSQFLIPVEPLRLPLAKSGLLEGLLAAIGLAILCWLLVYTWKILFRPADDPNKTSASGATPQPLTYGSVLYLFAYLGAVLFSMSFFDASTKFQPRILAPIYIIFMMMLVTLGAWLWRKKNRALQGCVLASILVTLASSLYFNFQAVTAFKEAGQGYASWQWHDSLIMATLRSLPPETAIYTNTPPGVYLVTGRASRVVPTPLDPVDNRPRGDYQKNVTEMRANLLAGRAVLALFDTSNLEDALGAQNGETLIPGLKILQKAQGDILYGKP